MAQKGVKTDVGELVEQLAPLLVEEMEKRKSRKEDPGDGEMTLTEQLAEVLPDLADIIDEKRKSRKDEDGEEADLTEDDFAAIVEEIADLLEGDGEPDEGKEGEDEGDKGRKEEGEGDEKRKGRRISSQRKTTYNRRRPPAPAQRKYGDVYMGGHGQKAATGGGSFKNEVKSLQGRDKAEYVYGTFGRAVKCLCFHGQGDPERAAFFARKSFNDAEMEREFKAQTVTSPSGGGYLVPEIYSHEIIELLYAQTIIFELGARRLSMEQGNINIPKMTAGAEATWIGEDRDVEETAVDYGNVKLSAKKLAALIPISNDLLRSTTFSSDQMVGQDLTRQMALAVDRAALYGKGGEFQPLGIANIKGITTVDATKLDAMYATPTGELTSSFPAYAQSVLLDKNIDERRMGWGMNARSEFFFKNIKSTTGDFIFLDEMNRGALMGYGYRRSSLIPTSKTNLTDIFLANWDDMIVGEQGSLMVETSREASYETKDGKTVSAFSRDQTLIRAIQLMDIAIRHPESFLVVRKALVPAGIK